MIENLVMVAALAAPTDDRPVDPRPSRSATRFKDSGHKVWNRTPVWIRHLALCVARHESINSGHYKANNPTSSASGRYQFIQSTWAGNARHTKGARKWAHLPASSAPPWVQDKVFIHSIKHGGIKAWHGTWCEGT